MSLKNLVSEDLKVNITNVDSDYLTKTKYHQAGYDAYITGMVFVLLKTHIKKNNSICDSSETENLHHLSYFKNKFHFSYSYDILHFDIGLESESVPDRNHVFYLTFPSSWKQSEIVELFSPYGNVVIGQINDTSAFIALKNKERITEACEGLKSSEPSNHTLTLYSDFVNNKNKWNNSVKRKGPEEISSVLEKNECNSLFKKSKIAASSSRNLFETSENW